MPDYSGRTQEVTLLCVNCGQSFVKRHRRVYCSVMCRLAANNRKRSSLSKSGEPATRPESTPAST
jgi:hypothetical protein